tara:strand:- start:246 stop:803 length:558 start_codon:yes stop_codon:yes gene_type:complete
MSEKYSFGRLFHHEIDYNGKWIKDLIRRISNLQCIFGEENKNNPNGISVHNPGDIFTLGQSLGEDIAKCLVSSYITKNITKYGDTRDEYFTVKHVLNMILFYMDRSFTTVVDKKVIEAIVVILNHPHFKGCKSIASIQAKIPSIDNLNNRFNGLCETSSDEEDNYNQHSCKGVAIPPKVPNIFFD